MVLLLECALILALARLLRRPAAMVGLPPVIAAVIAGLLLGPSGLGALAPALFATVVPPASLQDLSRLGFWIIAGYWFVVGLELEPARTGDARAGLVVTALGSAVVPGLVGYAVAGVVESRLTGGLLPPGALALSVALCFAVTAFPVLSRIVEDSGLSRQAAGTYSTRVSVVLELGIWACLPGILALHLRGDLAGAAADLSRAGLFVVVWLTAGRFLAGRLWARLPPGRVVGVGALAIVGLGAALAAKAVGVHPILGVFLGAQAVPRTVASELAARIKPVSVFLLPIFFATPGLRTSLLSSDAAAAVVTLGLIGLAYVVKVVVTTLLAHGAAGLSWRDAAVVGHLMGARGAIGFVLLEACLGLGLLEARSYSALACVVSATTVMAAWGATFQRRPSRATTPPGVLAAEGG